MSYLTVMKGTQAEITIEKSRFIAQVFPLDGAEENEEVAKEIVRQTQKKYWDATHNCYAYVLGRRAHIQKASDDGEPSGTAGVPILETIKKNELTDTAVVVTRYFGGIKLGAGGLVRAYTRATAAGIEQAQLVRKEEHAFFVATIDYATWSRIEQPLTARSLLHDRSFTAHVTVTVSVALEREAELRAYFDKWPQRQVSYVVSHRDYVDVPV